VNKQALQTPVPPLRQWLNSGAPGVWLTAGAVSFSLVMVFGLLLLIAVRGLGHFWPSNVARLHLLGAEAGYALGEVVDKETVSAARLIDNGVVVPKGQETVDRLLLKVGNRDLSGADFQWFNDTDFDRIKYPRKTVVIERREWGNFYGYVQGIREAQQVLTIAGSPWPEINKRIARAAQLRKDIAHVEKDLMGGVNYEIERLRLKTRRLELDGVTSGAPLADIAAERDALNTRYAGFGKRLTTLHEQAARDTLLLETVNGVASEVRFYDIVRAYRPNAMSVPAKLKHYFAKLGEFVSTEPREANTEGGVFPAIFGTVMMVLLMSVFVSPFGVIAAVYLREYAHQGLTTRIIRIAVNNLAGVPSVVYGVFGLGFFVYLVGGSLDQLFFPEALPAPTFGTPGLLWSSLTLALLTVPVVIVSTEEGLARIPRSIREGSLALGATKAETLWRTVMPMATPAMMTGLILAVARAAGEVAPLMMVGVVKLAPTLPLDGNLPFLPLDRKFMHLGFHIFDVGFQSPNVEAARPLVFATSLLLVLIIVALNLTAITIRNRLREKYNAAES
jgi:phosphate transport system permease protein